MSMTSLMRPRRAAYGLLLLAGLHGLAPAQETVAVPDSLSLQRAIDLALAHHPAVRVAEASLSSAEAGKRLALSPYFPSVGFTASATHTEGAFVFNPSFPPRDQIYSNYSTGFTATQLLYDFGKTSNKVGANSDLVSASSEDLRATLDAVVLNVQVAYFGALEAADVARVNEETVRQAADHLARARAFNSVGARPLLDVTRAEVDLANANVGLIRARNALQVSLLQLGNALGVHLADRTVLTGGAGSDSLQVTLDSARAIAYRSRPDILAAVSRYNASVALADGAWDQHLPTLSATGSYTWNGFDEKLYGRWTAGLTFSLPIFQGFAINAQVQQAQAASAAQLAQLNLTVENAMLDVEQTYLSVLEARQRIDATGKLVSQAEETLRLAERQYAAGVGTALDVTDAQIVRANARITAIQARFDYSTSLVRLTRAMGAHR